MRRPASVSLLFFFWIVSLGAGAQNPDRIEYKSPEAVIEDYSTSLNFFLKNPKAEENSDIRKSIYRNFFLYTRDNPEIVYLRKVYSDLDTFDVRDIGKLSSVSIRDYLDLVWYLVTQQKTLIQSMDYRVVDTLLTSKDSISLVMKKTVRLIHMNEPVAFAHLERFLLRLNKRNREWEIERIDYYDTASVDIPKPSEIIQMVDTVVRYVIDSSLSRQISDTTFIYKTRPQVFNSLSLVGGMLSDARFAELLLRLGRVGVGVDYYNVNVDGDSYYYPSDVVEQGSMKYHVLNSYALLFSGGYYLPAFLGMKDFYISAGAGMYYYNRYDVSETTLPLINGIEPDKKWAFKLLLASPEWRIKRFGFSAILKGVAVPSLNTGISLSLLPGFRLTEWLSLHAMLGGWLATGGNKGLCGGIGLQIRHNGK